MSEVPVRKRAWTDKITEHTIGRHRGVRVLSDTNNTSGGSSVSWPDGRHRTREEAETMIAELQEAVRVMDLIAREAMAKRRRDP